MATGKTLVPLPEPDRIGTRPLESVIQDRRTRREFGGGALTLPNAGQLMWSAQGETGADGQRAAPSAGGHWPLEICLVARRIDGLAAGAYTYLPADHSLRSGRVGDHGPALAEAAIGEQPWLAQPAAIIVLGADVASMNDAFADQPPLGQRGFRYASMEVGHAAQNIYLQAEAQGLAVVLVAGFDDTMVTDLGLLAPHSPPLALLAVGGRKEDT